MIPGINFNNILRAAFSYESFLRSFYVLTIWVCNFLAKGFWRKSCSQNDGEIDTRLGDFEPIGLLLEAHYDFLKR